MSYFYMEGDKLDVVGSQKIALYVGHRRAHGVYSVPSPGKETVHSPLGPEDVRLRIPNAPIVNLHHGSSTAFVSNTVPTTLKDGAGCTSTIVCTVLVPQYSANTVDRRHTVY